MWESESKREEERERKMSAKPLVTICVYATICSSIHTENTYGECMKKPDCLFLIFWDDCVSAGIPVLSGTWANVRCEILIAIVGGKEKKKLLHFSICFVRKQSSWIISWSGAFCCLNQLKSKIQVALDLPDSHTNTHTHTHSRMHAHTHTRTQARTHKCAHTPPVWSTTGYYWLTCLNSVSSKSHSNSFSILLWYESWVTWRPFFLTYLTFLTVTEICLSPSYLLPEKPCWLVFSHFTLGFIPLTPNAQHGWAAWPLESWMLDSSTSQGPELGFILHSECEHRREQTFLYQRFQKRQ